MNFSLLTSKIKKLLLSPKETWQEIKQEEVSARDLFKNYAIYIALVPALVVFLRYALFGVYVPLQGTLRMPIFNALLVALVRFGVNLLGLYVVAWLIKQLAIYFDSKVNQVSALKLVVYAVTPLWLIQVFSLVPFLGFLKLLGFYSVYLFYIGLPVLLETPEDRVFIFVFAIFFATLILSGILGIFVGQFVTLPAYVRFS